MQPDLIFRLEIGDGGDGEQDSVAGDSDVDLGAGEVEASLGQSGRRCGDEQHKNAATQNSHSQSLDAQNGEPGRMASNHTGVNYDFGGSGSFRFL